MRMPDSRGGETCRRIAFFRKGSDVIASDPLILDDATIQILGMLPVQLFNLAFIIQQVAAHYMSLFYRN